MGPFYEWIKNSERSELFSRVESGRIISLLGSNCAGKTTLINTISGLLRPRSGQKYPPGPIRVAQGGGRPGGFSGLGKGRLYDRPGDPSEWGDVLHQVPLMPLRTPQPRKRRRPGHDGPPFLLPPPVWPI
ncbi:MAG: ATP-binding cassette domain-containing protein [Deltaproteobacteria bacterium]|nr:ATP-binding cassette domain-containing protein [Deltaproteobacteria bacterium]